MDKGVVDKDICTTLIDEQPVQPNEAIHKKNSQHAHLKKAK